MPFFFWVGFVIGAVYYRKNENYNHEQFCECCFVSFVKENVHRVFQQVLI